MFYGRKARGGMLSPACHCLPSCGPPSFEPSAKATPRPGSHTHTPAALLPCHPRATVASGQQFSLEGTRLPPLCAGARFRQSVPGPCWVLQLLTHMAVHPPLPRCAQGLAAINSWPMLGLRTLLGVQLVSVGVMLPRLQGVCQVCAWGGAVVGGWVGEWVGRWGGGWVGGWGEGGGGGATRARDGVRRRWYRWCVLVVPACRARRRGQQPVLACCLLPPHSPAAPRSSAPRCPTPPCCCVRARLLRGPGPPPPPPIPLPPSARLPSAGGARNRRGRAASPVSHRLGAGAGVLGRRRRAPLGPQQRGAARGRVPAGGRVGGPQRGGVRGS